MWPNPQETKDLVTFTEEIFHGKLHFLCSVTSSDIVETDTDESLMKTPRPKTPTIPSI